MIILSIHKGFILKVHPEGRVREGFCAEEIRN
jgi:hypothetical protein